MNIRVISAALLLTAALAVGCAGGEGYDVYLCIGQSNMAGRGTMIPADTLPLKGVWLLDPSGMPEPARNPLNRYSTIRKSLEMQQVGPALEFSCRMRDASRRNVLLAVNARGGTGIDSWQRDGRSDGYYAQALARCRQAMTHGRLCGIIWHQGESDDMDPSCYAERLAGMVSDLRSDLGVGDVPVVIGEIARWLDCAPAINSELHRAEGMIPNCVCVSSEGCGMLRDEADPHFSRDGAILLGGRYADAMLMLQGGGRR